MAEFFNYSDKLSTLVQILFLHNPKMQTKGKLSFQELHLL